MVSFWNTLKTAVVAFGTDGTDFFLRAKKSEKQGKKGYIYIVGVGAQKNCYIGYAKISKMKLFAITGTFHGKLKNVK